MSRCMTADLYVGEHDEELAYDDDGVALLDDATTRRLHQHAHTAATRKVHGPHAPAVGQHRYFVILLVLPQLVEEGDLALDVDLGHRGRHSMW